MTSIQQPHDEEAGSSGCSFSNAKSGFLRAAEQTKEDYVHCFEEIKYECTPEIRPLNYYSDLTKQTMRAWIHIPYFPAFHRPGWLLRYIFGPYDSEWVTLLIADFCAGLTVALTLIPQALSYAQLANLPAINGLYTAILPSTTYVFFGSSMQLAVGPGNASPFPLLYHYPLPVLTCVPTFLSPCMHWSPSLTPSPPSSRFHFYHARFLFYHACFHFYHARFHFFYFWC